MLPEILTKLVLTKSLDSIVGGIKSIGGSKEITKNDINKIQKSLSLQLNKSNSFCKHLTVFRKPDKTDIETNTLELKLQEQDRRFQASNSGNEFTEDDILNSDTHILILGDVGSGKTTTLKRLCNTHIKLLFEEIAHEKIRQFPLVIKVGDLSPIDNLYTFICKSLGISYQRTEVIEPYTVQVIEQVEELGEDGEKHLVDKEKEIQKSRISYEYTIESNDITLGLPIILNELGCTIFIDGIDEAHSDIRNSFFTELNILSQSLFNSKIIATCRYLSETSSFKSFNHCEIKSLTPNQKIEIVKKWIENPSDFFQRLALKKYKDLTDRPLFLHFLVILYKNNNSQLPEQSLDIYRDIVQLVIKLWDDDKNLSIFRYTKYKSFNSNKKEDFLSELAYELTYNQNVIKSFSRAQLRVAYRKIYKRFTGLKYDDAKEVINDIESHNGLVIELYNNKFEFSHLSLQEYLAASYIVKIPFDRGHYGLLNTYPSPLAIANVISPRPDKFFSLLFLQHYGEIRNKYNFEESKIKEFLDRLLSEGIIFPEPSLELGLSLVYIFSLCNSLEINSSIQRLFKLKYAKESLLKTSTVLKYKKIGSNINFQMSSKIRTDLKIQFPEKGEFHKTFYWQ